MSMGLRLWIEGEFPKKEMEKGRNISMKGFEIPSAPLL